MMTALKLTEKLQVLLEPGARAAGFSIWSVDYVQQDGGAVLRVFIDSPQGVTVDDCAAVSWQLSGLLDVEDPLPGQYTLEVSSPGLDRPLVIPAHYQTVIGKKIKLDTYSHQLGRKRFTGQLVVADNEKIVLEVDNEVYEIPYVEIHRARLVAEV